MTTNLTPDEQELHELIERSLTDVLADAHRLETAAVVRGRTIRRRRRVVTGLAGAAAVVTVAAVVAPAVSGDSGTGRGLDPTHRWSNQQPASTGPGAGDPASIGWWSMPASEVHDRLLPLLPAGVAVDAFELAPDDRAPGEPDVSTGWLHATLTDSAGQTGDMEVFLYPPDAPPAALDPNDADAPSAQDRISCPANPGPEKTCVEIEDGEGLRVGRLLTWTPGDLVYREAAMVRADGGLVYAATANSTDDKWGWDSTTSAVAPPLTLQDLRSVVGADTWTDWEPPSDR